MFVCERAFFRQNDSQITSVPHYFLWYTADIDTSSTESTRSFYDGYFSIVQSTCTPCGCQTARATTNNNIVVHLFRHSLSEGRKDMKCSARVYGRQNEKMLNDIKNSDKNIQKTFPTPLDTCDVI